MTTAPILCANVFLFASFAMVILLHSLSEDNTGFRRRCHEWQQCPAKGEAILLSLLLLLLQLLQLQAEQHYRKRDGPNTIYGINFTFPLLGQPPQKNTYSPFRNKTPVLRWQLPSSYCHAGFSSARNCGVSFLRCSTQRAPSKRVTYRLAELCSTSLHTLDALLRQAHFRREQLQVLYREVRMYEYMHIYEYIYIYVYAVCEYSIRTMFPLKHFPGEFSLLKLFIIFRTKSCCKIQPRLKTQFYCASRKWKYINFVQTIPDAPDATVCFRSRETSGLVTSCPRQKTPLT